MEENKVDINKFKTSYTKGQEEWAKGYKKGTELIDRYARAEKVPTYIGLIASFAIMFFASFIPLDGNWNFDKVANPNFWIINGLVALSMAIFTITTVGQKMEEKELMSTKLENINKMMLDNVKAHQYSDLRLQQFLEYKNREIKARVYRRGIQKKIDHLNRHATFRTFKIWDTGTEKQKARSKYCRKRAKYEYLISDEFVEKNIDAMKIKCRFWDYSSMLIGFNSNEEEADSPLESKQHYMNTQGGKRATTKLIMPVLSTLVPTVLDFSNTGSYLTLVVRIAGLIYCFITAGQLAKFYVDKEEAYACDRSALWDRFFEWTKEEDARLAKLEEEKKLLEQAKLEEEKKKQETLSQSDKTTCQEPENGQKQQDTVAPTSENIENKPNTVNTEVTTQATVSPVSNNGGV